MRSAYIAACAYVLSYEPGITDKAVRIFQCLLIPGVFFRTDLAIPLNLTFGVALRFILRTAAARRFRMVFSLVVLIWNFMLTGLLDFVAADSASIHRWFRVGMQPGR